jgi:mRNA interferase YafQ
MPSKRPAQQKRAGLPRKSDVSRQFTNDWEKLSLTGRYDLRHLKEVLLLLLIANDNPLSAEYRDHALKGRWEGFRECHVGGDFLLIYDLRRAGCIVFVRVGTHAELFE